MIDKIAPTPSDALADVQDGSTVLVSGFGTAGIPHELIVGLLDQGAKDLTIVCNNAGNGEYGVAALLKAGRVRKVMCSFPRQVDSHVFDELYRSGKIELELVPQGNLAERIRAAGAGLGAVFCPTGYGTELAKGKETREIGGRHYVLEYPIFADLALVKAEAGDRWGNLVYRKAARNFGPVMAAAAKFTVASVYEVKALGELDPEAIVTPGIHVKRIVPLPRMATPSVGLGKPV
ncbi:3-oxoacid CoA-transferase subunit A [Burkholderia guangdongensis]|uniref:3-oxoacid CoA-transferase subunit A n=1 Tax=Burkholderia guangdongensis TaxID=1792500 RepID=UPI0015CAB285|nr:3-oxoacid CoA-transferase subunit A [Burkholderia guangdongensis]